MKKTTILALTLLLFVCIRLGAQVTIGSNSKTNNGSLLDLKENDGLVNNSTRGLLLPRVGLVEIGELKPMLIGDEAKYDEFKLSHSGLVVYNLTDDGIFCPGIYVWDSSKWIPLKPCGLPPIDPDLINSPNCYIVASGATSEEIPVGKPYLIWNKQAELGNTLLSGKVSLDLLWQDTEGLIETIGFTEEKGAFSKFQVKSKASKTGNALIALRVGTNGDKTDPIVWSWHIWVTNYVPDASGTVFTNGNGEQTYTFMDRNIGATTTDNENINSIGLLYQWGRKDPFTAPNNFGEDFYYKTLYTLENTPLIEKNDNSGQGIKHTPVTSSPNLDKSIQNPMNFYYHPTYNGLGDWFALTADKQNNDLWGGVSASKSPFDPCPKGWRVPAKSATKSPWAAYFEGWGIAGTQVENGFTLDEDMFAGTNDLGFYPLITFRKGAYNSGLIVGGNLDIRPGGEFHDEGETSQTSYYWTSATGNTNGNLLMTSNMMQISLMEKNKNREIGAFVRCVTE